MISCINEILDLIIKIIIISGIIILIIFYWKIKILDTEIERLNKNFENERNSRRGRGVGIPEEIINGQIEQLNKEKNEKINPLERERTRILSKIPFLK